MGQGEWEGAGEIMNRRATKEWRKKMERNDKGRECGKRRKEKARERAN